MAPAVIRKVSVLADCTSQRLSCPRLIMKLLSFSSIWAILNRRKTAERALNCRDLSSTFLFWPLCFSAYAFTLRPLSNTFKRVKNTMVIKTLCLLLCVPQMSVCISMGMYYLPESPVQPQDQLVWGIMHSTVKKLVNSDDIAMKGMNVSSFTRQLGFSMITSIIPRAQTWFFKDPLSAFKILAIVQCVYTVHEICLVSITTAKRRLVVYRWVLFHHLIITNSPLIK